MHYMERSVTNVGSQSLSAADNSTSFTTAGPSFMGRAWYWTGTVVRKGFRSCAIAYTSLDRLPVPAARQDGSQP